jgi:MFS family permease
VLAFVQGSGWCVWQLARVAYMSEVLPPNMRGRALSTLGGVVRVGFFVGPFIAAGLTAVAGFDAVYALALVLSVLAAAMLFRFSSASEGRSQPGIPVSFRGILADNLGVLFTAGIAALAIQALRAARVAIVPLWAAHIGLSVETAAMLFGMSLGVELLFVYAGGSAMDRYGRKATAIPCLVLMSLGLALLPLAQGVWSLALVSLLLGFGNGISSGVNMTLGVDNAPDVGRAEFLGIWRVFGDTGTAGGPVAVAAITALATLGAAAVLTGVFGLLAAVFVAKFVQETMVRDQAESA